MHSRQIPIQQIEADSKMADLIDLDCHILLVLNRFEISLGFGEKTVRETCEQSGVDTDCFIYIATLLSNPDFFGQQSFKSLNPLSVLKYLRNSHVYFLEKRLPDIGKKLEESLVGLDKVKRSAITSFFEQYVAEVYEHMSYENKIVFPYIDNLLQGIRPKGFSLAVFESRHSNIREKLTDLKSLVIKYITFPPENNYILTNMLFDLYLCEEDLNNHCFIEDKVLIPLVEDIENELKSKHVTKTTKQDA